MIQNKYIFLILPFLRWEGIRKSGRRPVGRSCRFHPLQKLGEKRGRLIFRLRINIQPRNQGLLLETGQRKQGLEMAQSPCYHKCGK